MPKVNLESFGHCVVNKQGVVLAIFAFVEDAFLAAHAMNKAQECEDENPSFLVKKI